MTKPEIYEALALIEDTQIAAHVQLNNAMDQLDRRIQKINKAADFMVSPGGICGFVGCGARAPPAPKR
jgi:hypothetical protein